LPNGIYSKLAMADQTKKSVPNQQKVNTIHASDQSNRFDKFGDSIDKREYRANQRPTSTTVWTIDMVRQALQDVARDAPINHPDKPPRSKSPFTCYALKNWKTIQEQFSRESPSEPSVSCCLLARIVVRKIVTIFIILLFLIDVGTIAQNCAIVASPVEKSTR